MQFLPSRFAKQPSFTSGYNGLLRPRTNYGYNPLDPRMLDIIENQKGQKYHYTDPLIPRDNYESFHNYRNGNYTNTYKHTPNGHQSYYNRRWTWW